jgi:micrococcal nuclease
MRMGLAAILLAAFVACTAVADGPAVEARGNVAEVLDGGTFVLADGRTIRLAALDVPRSGPDRRIGDTARAALVGMVAGQEIGLALNGAATDRYGRHFAHVTDASGRWVQAELVRQGLARVVVVADDKGPVGELLALEGAARAARRGLWALPHYRIVNVEDAGRFIDSFQIVEGTVREVARNGGRVFLNFGADWRSDFTILVPAGVRRQYAASGLDLGTLQGRMVRVRGWIKARNGPMVEIARAEQIEVIER